MLSAVIAAPLLVGIEPVGGDADRLYRPIKFELASALQHGTLPFWCDQFGTGVPLVAESHAAAYYPLNWLLYGLLDVGVAYRLAMWLHLVGCAAATAAYAGRCGCRGWGAALAGVTFAFCGFQAIHASHEVFYHALAYLPLCLWLLEVYIDSGRPHRLALLALASGAQWTLGHFQIATWTSCLVVCLGLWRVVVDRRPGRRLVGTMTAVVWGGAIAAAQLWPSWQLASFVGQTGRSVAERSFYSFPLAHLAELALPRLFRGIAGGPMADYWWSQQTTGYEVALFVGTLPVLLSFAGAMSMNRELRPWAFAIVASLVLATMPQWWPQGYALVLQIPGPGFFRAPARYTVIASLGLALFAGRGLDRGIADERFRRGVQAAVGCAVFSAIFAAWWTNRPQFASAFSAESFLLRFGLPASAWLIAVAAVALWRRGKCAAGVLVALAAMELAALYYSAAIDWGWHFSIPSSSVLTHLRENGATRVSGDLQNLPVYSGAATANPYLGFRILPPSDALLADGRRAFSGDAVHARWSRRLGVTHAVSSRAVPAPPPGAVIVRLQDAILDGLLERAPDERGTPWTIIRLPDAFPSARVVTQEHVSRDAAGLRRRTSAVDEPHTAHVLSISGPGPPSGAWATQAAMTKWDGRSGIIEHNGPCDLIVTRTYYPGWMALVNGEPAELFPVDGGLQGLRLQRAGVSRIELNFRPAGQQCAIAVSLGALFAALLLVRIDTRWPIGLQRDACGSEAPE